MTPPAAASQTTITPANNLPFPDTLRACRIQRGMSLSTLAAQSGIHKATLSRWESGARRPSLPELTAVLHALHVPTAQHSLFFASLERLRGLRALRDTASPHPNLPPVPCGGDLLRAMRLRKGRTQEDVAGPLSVAVSTVHRWERSDAWPDNTTLHGLCHLLDAHPAEVAALTRGRFALSTELPDYLLAPSRRLSAVDTLFLWLNVQIDRRAFGPDDEALEDLRFLVLEHKAWTLVARDDSPVALLLLAHIYTRRAEYLRYRYREAEALQYADRALHWCAHLPPQAQDPFPYELLRERSPQTLAVIFRAASIADLSDTAPAPIRRAVRQLLDHAGPLTAPNPELRASLLSRAADLLARIGDAEDAVAIASEACQLAQNGCPPTITRFRQRDLARVYLQLGRAAEAAPRIEELLATEPADVTAAVHVDDLLLHAEACLQRNHLAQAHQSLADARTIARAAHTTLHQRRMQTIEAALTRFT